MKYFREAVKTCLDLLQHPSNFPTVPKRFALQTHSALRKISALTDIQKSLKGH